MGDEIKLYTIKEATQILHMSARAIGQHIKHGHLKASKVGKFWLIRESDLQDFIDRGAPPVLTNRGRKKKEESEEE